MADYENTSDLLLIQELVQASSAISIDMDFYTFDYYTTTLDNQISMIMSSGTDKFVSVFDKAISDANNIGVRFKKGSKICFAKGTGSYASFTIAYYDTESNTVKSVSYSKMTGDDLHRGAVVVDGDEDFFVKVVDIDTRIEVSFKENICVTQLNIYSGMESETLLDSFVQLNDNKMEYKNTSSLNSVLTSVDTYSQSEIDSWSPAPTSSMQRIAELLFRINQCKLNIKDSINDVIPSSLAITNNTSFELYSDALNNAKGLNCRIYEGLFSNIPLRPASNIGAGWMFLNSSTGKFLYEPYKWNSMLAGFKIKSSDIQNVNWGENEKSVELNITIPSSNQKTTAQYFIDWEDTLKLYRGANSSIMYVWTPGVDGNGSTVSIGNHTAGYTYKFHLYADDNLILQIYSGSTLISSENVGIIPGNWDDLGEYIHFGSDASNSNEIQDNFIEMNSLSITTTKGSFEILPVLL